MSGDRPFSHPNAGRQIRIEQNGREVSITLVLSDEARADDICARLLQQAKSGYIEFRLMGKPTSIKGPRP